MTKGFHIKPKYQLHSIELQKQLYTYRLKYSSKAKYLRLQISSGNELEIVLPRGYQLKQAEDFIRNKSDWILKHLQAKKAEPEYLFFGRKIEIKQYYQLFIKNHSISYKEGRLEIRSPENSVTPLIELYNAWLRHSAKKYLIVRTRELAAKFGFEVKNISVRGQKTRWGSCSTSGSLSFNYRLIRFREEVIDYVIIHELCHLREMNHSEKFWSLVESVCPDYKKLRKELKGQKISS